jgi:transcriptional regulator with XRE-family HTH domain
MDENGVSTIGQNVALYRRALKMSAEDLAEAVGMTRSVVANLENGRKDDVTVKQLLALAKELGVSPMSLVIDTNDPGGQPDFEIPEHEIEEHDFSTGETRTVPGKARNHEAMNWFAGLLIPPYSHQSPAQYLAYESLSTLGNYSRSYSSWLRLATQIDGLRRERDADREAFEESGRHELLSYMESMIEDAAHLLAASVAACRKAGVKLQNTGAFVSRIMRGLGFEPPEFEDLTTSG